RNRMNDVLAVAARAVLLIGGLAGSDLRLSDIAAGGSGCDRRVLRSGGLVLGRGRLVSRFFGGRSFLLDRGNLLSGRGVLSRFRFNRFRRSLFGGRGFLLDRSSLLGGRGFLPERTGVNL